MAHEQNDSCTMSIASHAYLCGEKDCLAGTRLIHGILLSTLISATAYIQKLARSAGGRRWRAVEDGIV